MSPRTPKLTAKQVIKQLKNEGFIEISQTYLIEKLVVLQLFQFTVVK
jgi:hypothetical protein